jgi:Family of unknown function (DUF6282)
LARQSGLDISSNDSGRYRLKSKTFTDGARIMIDAISALREELREAGIVDTHYHVGPELIVRRYDVKTLADAATPFGATLVLKNHTYPTTPLASLARARFGARFLGGVVLNQYVGGLNPQAIEGARSGNRADVGNSADDSTPIVVWMPTVHAYSHMRVHGFSFDPRWSGCCMHTNLDSHSGRARASTAEEPVIVFDESGQPAPKLIATLEAMVRNRCILATGHLHANEVMRLVPLALEMGIHRVVLTHPHYPSIQLPDEAQKTLARRSEVFIEHCFAVHTQDGVPLRTYAEAIRITGPEQVLLSTDFGQLSSDPFPDGTIRYAAELGELIKGTVSRSDFVAMFSSNGRRALGLA